MTEMITLYSASSQAEIERHARRLFEQAGRPAGRDLDHWLQAEAEYRQGLRLNPSWRDPGGTGASDAAPSSARAA